MASPPRHETDADDNSPIGDINSSATRSRLDDLPRELCSMLVNFAMLEMRAVLAEIPHFRISPDDAARGRKRLCEWAAKEGYLDLLKWAHQRDYPLLQLGDGKDVCRVAARGGHLAVLQWLRQIRCRWNWFTSCAAADGGHLEVLQWAHQHGCPLNAPVAAAAAKSGHLRVLQWLRSQDCNWDDQVTLEAACNGRREVLEWAIAHGCSVTARPDVWPGSSDASVAVICCSGDLRMVEWALTQELDSGWYMFEGDAPGLTLEVLRLLKERRPDLATRNPVLKVLATKQLARVGDLSGLQWARENAYFDPDAVMEGAAEGGQLAVLKWASASKFPELRNVDILAENGHLECLKWAVANGKLVDEGTCARTAQAGHLSVLQWLCEIDCAWDGETLARALRGGHWEMFEWVRQEGCPVNARVFEAAAHGGYAEVLQWAFASAQGRIKLGHNVCEAAADTRVLKILRDNNCPWSEQTCTVYAKRGDLELLQWAVRNGCPWDKSTCSAAREASNLCVLKWAIENGCPATEGTRQWWNQFDLSKEFITL